MRILVWVAVAMLILALGLVVTVALFFRWSDCEGTLSFAWESERAPDPYRESWSTPQWTPDGSHIVFATTPDQKRPSQVHIVATDGSFLRPVAEWHWSAEPAVSPDGSRIAYRYWENWSRSYTVRRAPRVTRSDETSQFDGGIETASLDGYGRYRLTRSSDPEHTPVWSPDGEHIAFVRGGIKACHFFFWTRRPSGIFTMNADGSDVRRLMHSTTRLPGRTIRHTGGLAWSADGNSLYFEGIQAEEDASAMVGRTPPGDSDLFSVGRGGSGPDRLDILLPKRLGRILSPVAWSSDSQRAAYVAYADDRLKVYTFNLDGSGLREIVDLEPHPVGIGEVEVSWSPDGSQLVFSNVLSSQPSMTVREGAGNLNFVNADGSDLRTSSQTPGDGRTRASWSPDGSRIAVVTYNADGSDAVLYTMAPDRSDVRVLVNRRGDGTLEAVGPAHRHTAVGQGLPSSADFSSCSEGIVVKDPEANPGLVRDCEVLVGMRVRLMGTVPLNWDRDMPISRWEGVILSKGSPSQQRVWGFSLPKRGAVGHLPHGVTELEELWRLDLSGNELTGEIPSELSNLTGLRELDLSGNDLSGPIPPQLGSLAALEQLNLSKNRLSGPIPPKLGNLSSLEQLALISNDLSGPIPPELGSLSSLEQLTLRSNNLSGPIPSELGSLSELKYLDIGFTAISGCIPPGLRGKVSGYRDLEYCSE